MWIAAIAVGCATLVGAIAWVARARRRKASRVAKAEPIHNPAIVMPSPLPAIVAAERRRLARGSAGPHAPVVSDAALDRPAEAATAPAYGLRPSHARRSAG